MNRAAVYCRISNDPEGEAVGVARQEADCRALADRLGIEVVEVFTDNNIGASASSRKARPAYERMLLEAKTKRFSTILVYSTSRLTRRPRELEDLIDLHEDFDIEFKTVVSGDYDLSTASGITIARILASIDAGEAAQTAERLRAAHRHRALKGQVWKGGNRAFGWSDDYKTLHPAEAHHLKDAVEQVIRGVAITAIAKNWNKAGIKTPAGKEWNYQGLQTVLTNPRLCGRVTYRKETLKDEHGDHITGEWEPLVTEEVFEALVATVEKRKRPKRRFGKYLLSSYLRCGKCSGPMGGVLLKDRDTFYRCYTGHLSISSETADRYVRSGMFMHLSECRGAVEKQRPTEWVGEGRLSEVNSKITELMAAYNDGRVSGDILLPQVEKLDEERKQLTRERDEHYREDLVKHAPSLVDEVPKNVDALAGNTEWLEDWEDQIQEEYDHEGWQALLSQHCRTIFIKPYAGPHQSVTGRINILWDDGSTHGAPGSTEPMERARRPKPPEQLPDVMRLLERDPHLTGTNVATALGVSRSYGFRLLKLAREALASEPNELSSVEQ